MGLVGHRPGWNNLFIQIKSKYQNISLYKYIMYKQTWCTYVRIDLWLRMESSSIWPSFSLQRNKEVVVEGPSWQWSKVDWVDRLFSSSKGPPFLSCSSLFLPASSLCALLPVPPLFLSSFLPFFLLSSLPTFLVLLFLHSGSMHYPCQGKPMGHLCTMLTTT